MEISTDALIAISIIWGFVFIYAVMATMDFGAGFWSMIYLNKEHMKATDIANRFLSPTWEVTNVFIVAIVVALFSFFPGATFVLGTVLLIPGSMILLLLAIRSGFLVFSNTAKERKTLRYISGISGFIIPAILILVLPVTHGGFIEKTDGIYNLNMSKIFSSPNAYSFIGFAILSTLFLSSLLLADVSNVAEEQDAYRAYRKSALITGPISLLFAVCIMVTMRNEANWLYSGMLNDFTWIIASFITFVIAGIALFLPNKSLWAKHWKTAACTCRDWDTVFSRKLRVRAGASSVYDLSRCDSHVRLHRASNVQSAVCNVYRCIYHSISGLLFLLENVYAR